MRETWPTTLDLAGADGPLDGFAPSLVPESRPVRVSTVSQLTAEVDRLAAELAAARARISELETLVDVDPLSGLLNRRGFERELRRSIAYVERYGAQAVLIYLDLDDFKQVNDTFGHLAGDSVIGHVASLLRMHVRASDVVGRIGGDEFAIVLWNLDASTATLKGAVLEDLVRTHPCEVMGELMSVGLSVGVAAIHPKDTPAIALDRADRAMYLRKAERRMRG
jgi:diguanylate cyclase (GGDEF)-like protein